MRLIPELSFNLVQIPERIINLAITFISQTSLDYQIIYDTIQCGVQIYFHVVTLVATLVNSRIVLPITDWEDY